MISCDKCGASYQESICGATIKFWAKECMPWRVIAAATRFKKREDSLTNAVEKVAKFHGSDLVWSKNIYGTVRCQACEWHCPVHEIERFSQSINPDQYSEKDKRDRRALGTCLRDKAQANRDLERFRTFKDEYEQRERTAEQLEAKHDLKIDGYILYCTKCWVYAAPTAVPQRHDGPLKPETLNEDYCTNLRTRWKQAKQYWKDREITEAEFLQIRRGFDVQTDAQ